MFHPLENIYKWGDSLNKFLKKPRKLSGVKIVSVGNIVSGGTGKTPATIYLAKLLSKYFNLGILSRGYGGAYVKSGKLISDRNKLLVTPEEAGDEPFLIASNLLGIPVHVGRNRYSSGLNLQSQFNCDLMLLDDGFQHYALSRDVDIVLIDATNPFSNGHLIPRGFLREPLESLRRSDIVIMTKVDLIDPSQLIIIENKLKEISQHQAIFQARHLPQLLYPVSMDVIRDDLAQKIEMIKGKSVWAFSAIGNHKSFERSLIKIGVKQIESIYFRDHYKFTIKDIKNLLKKVSSNDYIITTEKDWVKLKKFSNELSCLKNFFFLKIKFDIYKQGVAFEKELKSKIMVGKVNF